VTVGGRASPSGQPLLPVRSLPGRLWSRTLAPSFRAITRKPSCLISCSHNGPKGGSWSFVGTHGAINPAGTVRSFNTGGVNTRARPGKARSAMEKDYLLLKRASASRPSGEWNDDDYDVLADGVIVGRIFKVNDAPVGQPSMWTLAMEHHENRASTHGYAATREAAMAAFAKSWRRE
jgi:hypothetical protein